MAEGYTPERASRADDSLESFRGKLDLIITDETAGYGFKQNAYEAFQRDLLIKRQEVKASGGDEKPYEQLAAEAETRWLNHRKGEDVA